MKNPVICGIFILVIGLLAPQIATAQGTATFLSNLGQTPSGSNAVGSDSWLAADFITGNNTGGYVLNSIQLAMMDSSGNPSGFTVMIFGEANNPGTILPGSSLGTLTGSANPTAAGTYTYSPVSTLSLSPNAYYFIVLTAGTTVANGAYDWSVTADPSPGYTSFHWGGEIFFADSSNGSQWNYTAVNYGQFALDATPAPEPDVIGLLALGGLLIGFRRCKARSAQ